MQYIKLPEEVEFSRIVHGYWRLKEWNLSKSELSRLINEMIDMGITTFDHADIYGDYECEALFGEAFDHSKRNKVQLVTKCGVKLASRKFPERNLNIYDYSYDHIIQSAERSLKNLKTDHIDVLLFHRPSPFFDPHEVSKAVHDLKRSGKVLHFGVSNFTQGQFEMLARHLDVKLVTNQVEISPLCLEHFDNGNMDFFLKVGIHPMAWSPVAGGRIFRPKTSHELAVKEVILETAAELGTDPDTAVYAWLLKHPSGIIPIVGSHRKERIKAAVDALDIDLSLEQWFRIFIAGWGKNLP